MKVLCKATLLDNKECKAHRFVGWVYVPDSMFYEFGSEKDIKQLAFEQMVKEFGVTDMRKVDILAFEDLGTKEEITFFGTPEEE